MPGSPMGPGAPVIPGKPINPVTPLSPLKKKKKSLIVIKNVRYLHCYSILKN